MRKSHTGKEHQCQRCMQPRPCVYQRFLITLDNYVIARELDMEYLRGLMLDNASGGSLTLAKTWDVIDQWEAKQSHDPRDTRGGKV